jgi:hypothetical protein
VALIGGIFHIVIVVSSIVIGSVTDTTRSYFLVTLLLLILGFRSLRVGGPLLPVATELGVEIAHPLSDNTAYCSTCSW